MKLYKYRSLRDGLDLTLDAVLNERLYCADYRSLNDPLEGLFAAAIGPFPAQGILGKTEIVKSVEDLLEFRRACHRVCSLSRPLDSLLLWSHYADEHRGVAIEIDFPDGGDPVLYQVQYVQRVERHSDTILGGTTAEEVLSFKMKQWEYEEEFRIIQPGEFYSVEHRISPLFVGSRISDLHLGILKRCVPANIPLIGTRVDWRSARVVPGNVFDRGFSDDSGS